VAGVKRYEDLIAYQRSVELRDLIYEMTAGRPVAVDRRFTDQVRDSSSSVARNLAEGFGRFAPQDFRRFVTIARGSLTETQHHLTHGLHLGYFTPTDYERAWNLSCRALAAVAGLGRYLKSCKGVQ
jgi:four helix bundle protein